MTLKYLLLFALCFLVGAAIAIGVRSVGHRPYAEATGVHDMTAPSPAKSAPAPPGKAPGHEGHGSAPAPAVAPTAPAPAPITNDAKPPQGHDQHGAATSPAPADPMALIGNTICPSCGMDVDPTIPPVKTAQGSIGIGCAPCVPKITRDPGRFVAAARENRKAK